jgi:hypothetical protein
MFQLTEHVKVSQDKGVVLTSAIATLQERERERKEGRKGVPTLLLLMLHEHEPNLWERERKRETCLKSLPMVAATASDLMPGLLNGLTTSFDMSA